jgi:hypothetical protein
VPQSNALKQQRYRERKKAEEEARFRFDRGLPEPPPAPTAPDGAYLVDPDRTDAVRPKFGHYRAKDGTFPEIPDDILHEEDGRLPDWHQKQLAQGREPGTPNRISADRSILFED